MVWLFSYLASLLGGLEWIYSKLEDSDDNTSYTKHVRDINTISNFIIYIGFILVVTKVFCLAI